MGWMVIFSVSRVGVVEFSLISQLLLSYMNAQNSVGGSIQDGVMLYKCRQTL